MVSGQSADDGPIRPNDGIRGRPDEDVLETGAGHGHLSARRRSAR